jgi:hypothetical protein
LRNKENSRAGLTTRGSTKSRAEPAIIFERDISTGQHLLVRDLFCPTDREVDMMPLQIARHLVRRSARPAAV